MPRPCVLGRRDGPSLWVVEELGVLAQSPPKTVLLTRVIRLVDQVALVGVGDVLLDEFLGRPIPGFGLESA